MSSKNFSVLEITYSIYFALTFHVTIIVLCMLQKKKINTYSAQSFSYMKYYLYQLKVISMSVQSYACQKNIIKIRNEPPNLSSLGSNKQWINKASEENRTWKIIVQYQCRRHENFQFRKTYRSYIRLQVGRCTCDHGIYFIWKK